MRLLRYGERALLVEPADATQILGLADAAAAVTGVVEVVPAARTVLVAVDDPHRLPEVQAALEGYEPGSTAQPGGHGADTDGTVVLDVVYDGADLAATAADFGMDTDALVRAHTAGEYIVAFCGFAPGFAYLTGLDPALHVPRLAEPRTRVPAGSVGIAGEFTGVYPRSSPGGWRLLGRTDATLWDAGREPPALLAPGTRVRFRPA